MWKLLYPLRYFRIASRERARLDLVPTLALALIIWIPFVTLDNVIFFQPNGFLDKFLTLSSCLTGFYIAALVAAATFSHPDLDKVVKSGPVALVGRDMDGKKIQTLLTRREYACAIFGYLSFSSLSISIACTLGISLSSAVLPSSLLQYSHIIRGAIALIYVLAIAHLFVATCIGLYYLMDRLYRHDQVVTTKKPDIKDRVA